MRRNIVRYAVLAYVITLKHVSVRVKKRFPTLQHIVDAGILMESEKKIIEMMDERSPMAKYWMPLVWATNIINRARKEALISSDHVVQTLLYELSEHRRKLGSIISYDTVCVPLVYTQSMCLEGNLKYRSKVPKGLQSKTFLESVWSAVPLERMCQFHTPEYFLSRTTLNGLMMESERKIFELMDERHPMTKYWLPLTWATNIINRARREATITSDHMVQTILNEMSDMRWRLGSLIGYDNVNLPLVYTQVVTISVYTYFVAALLGAQITDPRLRPGEEPRPEDMDVYVPIFTVLQFCFYLGWLKVAEVLIGPFGEDDDDIELNWLIDRHIKAAYMIVDEMHEEHPELLKDQYWDEVVPKDLPYTLASECYRRTEPKGSAEFYKVKEADSLYANITRRKSVAPDEVYADYESVDTPMVERRKNWFQKQIHRMGSVRSSSIYSSNRTGLFGRTRHNSVYSSPENGGMPPTITVVPDSKETLNAAKLTLYDKLVGGKSASHRHSSTGKKPNLKLNGSATTQTLRNRPRIPTPDVTKEDHSVHPLKPPPIPPPDGNTLMITTSGAGNTTTTVPYSTTFSGGDLSLGQIQVVLSPILESDPNHQMTITSTSSMGAAALAQAVLNPALMSSHIGPPVTVSPVTLGTVSISQPMLSSLGINSVSQVSSTPGGSLTEIVSDKEGQDSACGSSSGSVSSTEDRSRKTSTTSQAKRGEVYV